MGRKYSTSQYKYLGLLLNEHLDWNVSIEGIHVISKANRALALLNHRMRVVGGFQFRTYTLLFNQLVQSIEACVFSYTWSKSLADTGITNCAEHMSNLLSSLYENNLLQQDYAVDDLWDVVMEQELQAW